MKAAFVGGAIIAGCLLFGCNDQSVSMQTSAGVAGVSAAATIPRSPSNLSGVLAADGLQLQWQDNSDSEYYFELRVRLDNGTWLPSVFLDPDNQQASLALSTTAGYYDIQLRAGNNFGESDWVELVLANNISSDQQLPDFSSQDSALQIHSLPDHIAEGAYLYMGRDDGVGIDLVVVAEGYQASELDTFTQDASDVVTKAFDFFPLSTYLPAWNIHFLALSSAESGADYVDGDDDLRSTRFGARFWCHHTERLLCVDSVKVTETVAQYVPQYDQILVLVNTEKYGGAGYSSLATTSLASASVNIIRHEFGHSFAGLADEYDYGRDTPYDHEPSQPNLSLIHDPSKVKWSYWFDQGVENVVLNDGDGVGLWEGGGCYSTNVYRPTRTSMMAALGKPFYQVNAEAWALAVYDNAKPIVDSYPNARTVIVSSGRSQWFALSSLYDDGVEAVEW